MPWYVDAVERYEELANKYAAAINAGEYDRPDRPFPALRVISDDHNVAIQTAQRVVGQLSQWGLVITRKGARTLVVDPELRTSEKPLTGRYARARAARGLVFQTAGMSKVTEGREWAIPPEPIAELLQTGPRTKVLHRRSRTVENGSATTELTSMFFPRALVKEVPELDEDGGIKVVELIEATGRTIQGTRNSIIWRPANESEADALEIPAGSHVVEHTHGTYAEDEEPVEAVINVYRATGTRLTFDTYEGPIREQR